MVVRVCASEYDQSFGERRLFGTIWFTDGSWVEVKDHDGSEYWEHMKIPEIPKNLKTNNMKEKKYVYLLIESFLPSSPDEEETTLLAFTDVQAASDRLESLDNTKRFKYYLKKVELIDK